VTRRRLAVILWARAARQIEEAGQRKELVEVLAFWHTKRGSSPML